MSNATLTFLPWVRQGAAAAITAPDTLGPKQSAIADVAAAVTLNGQTVTTPAVKLRGPADVIGVDANQVVRTDPRPGTTDFEPNCFPSIEFDRADFPWLFTPARANANTQLRPWLCLVVVRKQPGVTLASPTDVPLATLTIAAPAKSTVELPDLKDSWAWAHTQVAADDSTQPLVAGALNGRPELSLSRLVCPRVLVPDTDYIACVVPTFDLGRKAGLGMQILDTDLTAVSALAPAWTSAPPPAGSLPATVILPVFYSWEFRTGQGGDFESLALKLTPSVPAGLGKRPIDIGHPGFPIAGVGNVDLEGALLPIPPVGSSPPPPPADPIPTTFKSALGAIINKPGQVAAVDPNADPVLAPPIYGRWHQGKATVSPAGTTWLDQLNLDPRWRVAAAFGTRVIQEHQETLMTSAWEQAGELQNANQRMRQLQLSMAVGEVIHARHLSPLGDEAMLRFAAPAFARLRTTPVAGSMLMQQTSSRLPVGATRSAMRRIGRQRGPLSRRVAAQGVARSVTFTWVARMNDNMGQPLPPPPPAPPVSDFAALPAFATQHLSTDSFFGAFFVAPETAPVNAPGTSALVTTRTEVPGFFRAAAVENFARFFPVRSIQSVHIVLFQTIRQQVLDLAHPRRAIPVLANAILSKGDNVLASTAAGITPIGVETVMAAPSFPQPMYEALRDISQDLFLPGLDTVKPDTVLGLKTNHRFVDAYMVGLNHEMGRELLWRGYPTDQRGTYFSHFWGNGVPNTAPADINPLHLWKTRGLGDSVGAPAPEEFVMLLRSSLLKRYPNAIIYLTPAVLKSGVLAPNEDPAQESPPIFIGALQPDVSFFGFAITADKAIGRDGGPGYYVVIQEHPTEPRFGLDVSVSQAMTTSHLVIGTTAPQGIPVPTGHTWGRNSAHMAGITRRLPVRIAIHAARLIAQAAPATPGVHAGSVPSLPPLGGASISGTIR